MDILAMIDRTDFFSSVADKSKELLAQICIPRQVSKKETLFYEGDKGFSFYLLVSGAVGLYKHTPDGREIVIKVVKPGEPFAEVILFEQESYPVTAVVLKAGLLFAIPKHQFNCLLERPDFRTDFIAMLMRKQRYLAERIRFLTMHDVEDRLFLHILEHYGKNQKVITALSKKDMAAAIGATPETYSRLLNRLSKEGKIKTEGNTIHINEQFWNTFVKEQEKPF